MSPNLHDLLELVLQLRAVTAYFLYAILECLYLIIYNGDIGITLWDHSSVSIKLILFNLQVLEPLSE